MKKFIIAIIFILSVSLSAFGQKDMKKEKADDSKAALAVVNKLFDEMAAYNPEGILALHLPDSQLVALIRNREGKTNVRIFKEKDFSGNFAVKRAEIKEVMYAPKTEVHGDLALVWGRYVFFVDGRVAHCGVNSFHLVREAEGWKIANSSSTIEPQGCTEKEKAMKSK